MANNGFMKNWWLYLKRGVVATIIGGIIGVVLGVLSGIISVALPAISLIIGIVMFVLMLILGGWVMSKTVEDWVPK